MESAVASHLLNVTAKVSTDDGQATAQLKMRTLVITGVLGLLVAATTPAPASASRSAQPQSATSSASAPAHKPSTTSSTSKKKKSSHRHSSKREPFQKAPTPDRISEIQTALSRGGYYVGEPNGKWDSNTVGAMQKFQSDNGLNASGKISATSLQKLGLGSSTAGVDAPKPIKKTDPGATTSAALHPTVSATNANSASTATPAPTAAASKPPQH
jgi:peptidoglycan hydrolase-like protein with peptidoglycan-binding domain